MTTFTESVTDALAYLNKFEDLDGKDKRFNELRVYPDSDTGQR